MKILHISGAGMADDVFTIETKDGEINWNVTRLKEAAKQGVFGRPIKFKTSMLGPSNYENVSRDKIDAFKKNQAVLDDPVIAIESKASTGGQLVIMCFPDGSHRLIARQELGLPDWSTYLVPNYMEEDFRVEFNKVEVK
jgi:hypothetical protein